MKDVSQISPAPQLQPPAAPIDSNAYMKARRFVFEIAGMPDTIAGQTMLAQPDGAQKLLDAIVASARNVAKVLS